MRSHDTDNWSLRASCRFEDPAVWHPEGDSIWAHRVRVYRKQLNDESQFARSVCARCPVLAECLEDVMLRERGAGVYGRHGIVAGLDPEERVRLYKTRMEQARKLAAKQVAEDEQKGRAA